MCIACHWGKFLSVSSGVKGGGLTRRAALKLGVAFAATSFAGAPVAALAAGDAAGNLDGPADIVFRNGTVYTVDDRQPIAKAVAVKGKHIAYVGDEAGLSSFIGPQTRVVDLAGKMLMPGFVEGHTHPLVGATLTRGVDLQYDTREETLAALRAYRDKIGPVDIVRGFGWRYLAFPEAGPRKEDLDAIWPDTPVTLFAIDAHGLWANSQALAIAGITKDSPDPVPGFSYFQRDPKTGEPTGYMVEVPAAVEVMNRIEPFSADYVATALAEWLPRAAAAGITTVFEAGTQAIPEVEGFGIYQAFEKAGKLPFRVVGDYYHNRAEIDPVPVIEALNRQFRSELVQVPILKLNMDGGDTPRTAAMIAPYSDAPEVTGDTLLPFDLFKDIVRRADAAGIDIHVHSYGDRATRLSLDAIEAAIAANPPRDRRNALAHILLVDPADIPRFGKLGVVAQYSGQWAVPDPTWTDITALRFGPVRSQREFTMQSVLAHGGVVSFGTDWPAAGYYSTYKPLDAIEGAVTRREIGKPNGPQLAPVGEALTLDQALKAATLGPAHQLRMEDRIGSITAGKLADLVVLERNLFEIPASDIHAVTVAMTLMNGRITHEAAA